MRIVASLSLALVLAAFMGLPVQANEGFKVDPQALAAVDRFESVWANAKSATYRIVKTERLRNGKTATEELKIKFQKPGSVYAYMVRPIAGRELLYDHAKDPKHLKVHNGAFPDLTLNLDAYGMLATHNQHHTIRALGFDQVVHVLRSALTSAQREPHGEYLEYAGERTFAGRAVDYVIMHAGQRPARKETARDESLFAFAERVDMDPYVIFMANPQIRSLHSELDEGESYMVPAYYAQRCDSWFDKETGMPLKQIMYDAAGNTYESYEHYEIVLNAPLGPRDFDAENPEYGF